MAHPAARILIALLLLFAPAHAQQGSPEDRIKAAFLYKFAGYVEWPENRAQGPIHIGVLGSDAIAAELEQLLPGRVVGNRPLSVRKVEPEDLPDDLHILFVAEPRSASLAAHRAALQKHGVLIVTEAPDMPAQESVINFLIVDQRVKFTISLDAAAKTGLKLSSRLLAVAHRVTGAS